MEQIEDWFNNNGSYDEGVEIYNSLPFAKRDVKRRLSKKKSNYTEALLIKVLRKANTHKTKPIKSFSAQKNNIKPSTDLIIAKEHQQSQLLETSHKEHFREINYANLPPELKIRYRKASDLFYQMMDLKFVLNDIPKKNTAKALSVQLEIEEADGSRLAIWKELNHWKKHKTLLPSETDDLSDLNSDQLRTKKARAKSSITKLNTRINGFYDALDKEINMHKKTLLENKINKSEKRLHRHNLNILKINELL